MTFEEQLNVDQRRAHDYWMAKAASYEKPVPQRNRFEVLERVWFPAGVIVIFTAAMFFAWQPVILHGADALAYSIFWSVFWLVLCSVAIVDVRRRERSVKE